MSSNSSLITPFVPSHTLIIGTSISLIILGILGLLSSTMTIVVLMTSKQLRTPCFILIAGGAAASFVIAAFYLMRGINKTRLELGLMAPRRSVLECLLLDGVLGLFGVSFQSLIPLAIALDRLFSITLPTHYRHLGRKYPYIVLAVCCLISVAEEMIGFWTVQSFQLEMSCAEFNQAVNPSFMKAYAGFNLFYVTLNVAVYAAMLLAFHLRRSIFTSNNAGNTTNAGNEKFMRQQAAVIPTIQLMALLYFFTGIMAEIFVNVRSALPSAETAYILGQTGSVLKAASSLVEGLSLLVRSKTFRNCLRRLLRLESNEVGGMEGMGGTSRLSISVRK